MGIIGISQGDGAIRVGERCTLKIAIAQPTYLPWLGYFDLIDQVDLFVVLDSVQFERQSWQQRNRIKTPIGLQWLTVPVVFRGRLTQHIRDVEIRVGDFWKDHVRAIELNYGRSAFFGQYFAQFRELMQSLAQCAHLVELNLGLMRWHLTELGIGTRLLRSSELRVTGKRTELLANICTSVGAASYLSPLGAAAYLLDELATLTDRGVEVAFQNYEHPTYRQMFLPFIPYACTLDLLLNEGDRTLEIVRSGRRAPFRPQEARLALTKERGAHAQPC
jgi:hypothetical protein